MGEGVYMALCKEKLTISDLVKTISAGCKTDELIGLEYERLPVDKKTEETISYYGNAGVCSVLKQFAREDNWDYIEDEGQIIGLKKLHDSVTLEPGSQVELSVEPQSTIEDLKNKVDTINKSLLSVFDDFGIKLLNYGIYPITTYKNIKLIPKKRYDYMANYLWGILSDVMMRETAGIQVGIDFKSEDDAIRKFNLANKISPFVTAMCANSSMRGGVNTGYKSFRALAWLYTDNERCGLATKLKHNMTFEDYVKTLLKVPVIFIRRDNKYIFIDGKINFAQFMKNGYEGYEATIDDFNLHSNLFFPDIRLRNFIEIRNHDCMREDYMYSLLAFYKGLFYNPDAISQVEELLHKITYNDISEFRYNIPKYGLKTTVKRNVAGDITKELFKIAQQSLRTKGDSDERFIYPLMELNKQGLTPEDIKSCN